MKQLIIHTDGGSRGNPGHAAIGVVAYDELKNVVFELSRYIGRKTNNEAEYEGLIEAVKWLGQQTNLPTQIDIYLDSKLVVEQIQKKWKIKKTRLQGLAAQAWQIIDQLSTTPGFHHVPREKNFAADALVNQALDAL